MLLPTAPNDVIGRWLQRLSPMGEWNGPSTHLPDVKVQEWMGYSQPYCESDGGLLSLTWSGFSMPAW